MASTPDKELLLLPQESRTSRSRYEGTIVPDPLESLSRDGPTDDCSARSSAENVIARQDSEETARIFVKPGPASSKGDKKRKRSVKKESTSTEMDVDEDPETISLVSGEEGSGSGSEESYISEGGTKRKRGRSQTTGLYAGRAEAKKKLAEQEERFLQIEREKELRALTTEELYAKSGLDLDAIDRMRRNPSADLSNRARELQRNVVIVAKISKNLKGPMQKLFKDATLITTACIEVLRSRMDNGPDTDAAVQLRDMKERLEIMSKEKDEALKKVTTLEKALQEKNNALERIEKLEKTLRERKSPVKDGMETARKKRYFDFSSEDEVKHSRKKTRSKSSFVSPKYRDSRETPMHIEESTEGEVGDSFVPSSSAPLFGYRGGIVSSA